MGTLDFFLSDDWVLDHISDQVSSSEITPFVQGTRSRESPIPTLCFFQMMKTRVSNAVLQICAIWSQKSEMKSLKMCFFPNHVKSSEFRTIGLQSGWRKILRMSCKYIIDLHSVLSHGKGRKERKPNFFRSLTLCVLF